MVSSGLWLPGFVDPIVVESDDGESEIEEGAEDGDVDEDVFENADVFENVFDRDAAFENADVLRDAVHPNDSVSVLSDVNDEEYAAPLPAAVRAVGFGMDLFQDVVRVLQAREEVGTGCFAIVMLEDDFSTRLGRRGVAVSVLFCSRCCKETHFVAEIISLECDLLPRLGSRIIAVYVLCLFARL